MTHIKTFQQLTNSELYEILKARFQVFVMEQHCFYLDMDDIDYKCIHLYTEKDGIVKSYARLFPETSEGDMWHVGRVLTIERGIGLGKDIMLKVIDEAKSRKAKLLRMDAQCHATKFYENLGFSICSEPFMEAGIPHVMMQMKF